MQCILSRTNKNQDVAPFPVITNSVLVQRTQSTVLALSATDWHHSCGHAACRLLTIVPRKTQAALDTSILSSVWVAQFYFNVQVKIQNVQQFLEVPV